MDEDFKKKTFCGKIQNSLLFSQHAIQYLIPFVTSLKPCLSVGPEQFWIGEITNKPISLALLWELARKMPEAPFTVVLLRFYVEGIFKYDYCMHII